MNHYKYDVEPGEQASQQSNASNEQTPPVNNQQSNDANALKETEEKVMDFRVRFAILEIVLATRFDPFLDGAVTTAENACERFRTEIQETRDAIR